MLLYIIRHGIPDYVTNTLLPEGQKQAEALAKRLQVHGIDEVYASPMGRAKETAEPTCRALGLPMQIEDFMSEQFAWDHFKGYNGEDRPYWTFHMRYKYLWDDSFYTAKEVYGREVYFDDDMARKGLALLKEYSDGLLARLGYEKTGEGNGYRAVAPSEKKVAVFCHQGFGLHWMAYLLNFPLHVFVSAFDISHSGFCIIRLSAKEGEIAYPQCLSVSDLSHLYKEELPLLYQNDFGI